MVEMRKWELVFRSSELSEKLFHVQDFGAKASVWLTQTSDNWKGKRSIFEIGTNGNMLIFLSLECRSRRICEKNIAAVTQPPQFVDSTPIKNRETNS